MALLDDLQNLAGHLSPSDFGTSDPLVGALIKVLDHEGLKVPAVDELLPEDHPSQISPPAPTGPAPTDGDRLSRIEAALERLVGHNPQPSGPASTSSDPGEASAPRPVGSETSAPSSEPVGSPDAPELDRP